MWVLVGMAQEGQREVVGRCGVVLGVRMLAGCCAQLPNLAPKLPTCRLGPLAACEARSSLSTSSSLSTACLPWDRIHAANLGSRSSMASANSLRRHWVL